MDYASFGQPKHARLDSVLSSDGIRGISEHASENYSTNRAVERQSWLKDQSAAEKLADN